MLKLKNVSKFYYNKGVIASGFSKINIEFNLGEFVAIIGESGSGKSTLLNVISGLDSYEEGEMYINGEETSHYREVDFEEYRKKYVSNIFQNFNLVNSYTVYQNIELVMLLNGYKRKAVKEKVLELINKVGLKKYRNTKVSKLSGGQKQRVAIARALAKDTPIIVCDEPTGNLDSKSAGSVIKLLKEVASDKLVIVVTHNFSEIEDLATRVVKMHDGRIVSDKKVTKTEEVTDVKINNNKGIGIFNMFRLGFRNTFNILSKFILIFIVFFFVTTSLLSTYGGMRKAEYEEGKLGMNYYFSNTDDKRIVIKKRDGSFISQEELSSLEKIENVSYVYPNDVLLDYQVWFETEDDSYFNLYGTLNDLDTFSGELDYGRMPENDNEAIYVTFEYDYYFSDKVEDATEKTYFYNGDKNNIGIKIVGVKYIRESYGLFAVVTNQDNAIYLNKSVISKFTRNIDREHSKMYVNINGKNHESYYSSGDNFDVRVNGMVPSGAAYVSENISYACKDYNCKKKTMNISVENLYYERNIDLTITNVYTDKNIKKLLGISKDNPGNGPIYINPSDYDKLFVKDTYQASVFANDVDNVDSISTSLEEMGYKALPIKNTLANLGGDVVKVIKIAKLVVTIFSIVTLFFIAYFVIKLILKSRNVYYSTLRILGANYKHIKRILDIELFTNATLAYLVYMVLTFLVKNSILDIPFINNIFAYLNLFDYVLMYIILVLMSYLISGRYARKIFKSSAMKSYREEV